MPTRNFRVQLQILRKIIQDGLDGVVDLGRIRSEQDIVDRVLCPASSFFS